MDFISEADTLPPPRKKFKAVLQNARKYPEQILVSLKGMSPWKPQVFFVTQQVTIDLQMAFDPPLF